MQGAGMQYAGGRYIYKDITIVTRLHLPLTLFELKI